MKGSNPACIRLGQKMPSYGLLELGATSLAPDPVLSALLDLPRRAPYPSNKPVGRTAAASCRGKSGLHGDTAPDNVRRGRPQGKRHRKQTAGLVPVRVKGCGKSAPPRRQRRGHGKPRREQNRIGATESLKKLSTRLRDVARVGCSRRSATTVPEEWPSRAAAGNRLRAIQNPAYRPAGSCIFAVSLSRRGAP